MYIYTCGITLVIVINYINNIYLLVIVTNYINNIYLLYIV